MKLYCHLESRDFINLVKVTDDDATDMTVGDLLDAFVRAFNARHSDLSLSAGQLLACNDKQKPLSASSKVQKALHDGADVFISIKAGGQVGGGSAHAVAIEPASTCSVAAATAACGSEPAHASTPARGDASAHVQVLISALHGHAASALAARNYHTAVEAYDKVRQHAARLP